MRQGYISPELLKSLQDYSASLDHTQVDEFLAIYHDNGLQHLYKKNIIMIFETLNDHLKTKKDLAFLEKIIDQAHSDPEIRTILDMDRETAEETKVRILKGTRFER